MLQDVTIGQRLLGGGSKPFSTGAVYDFAGAHSHAARTFEERSYSAITADEVSNDRTNSITVTTTLDIFSDKGSPPSKVPTPYTIHSTDFGPPKPLPVENEVVATNDTVQRLHSFDLPPHPSIHAQRISQENWRAHNSPGTISIVRLDTPQQITHKLPPFQQSRQWAKVYGKEYFEKPPRQPRPMTKYVVNSRTKREVLSEQQKAERPTQKCRTPSIISDKDSSSQRGGLCRSLSLPSLRILRRSGRKPPNHHPAMVAARRDHQRGAEDRRPKTSHHQPYHDISSTPPSIQTARFVRPQRAFGDLRKRAGYRTRAWILGDEDNIVDLDNIDRPPPPPLKNTTSPVPTLHDAAKAKRFSEECEAILANVDFDRDWLITGKGTAANSHVPQGLRQAISNGSKLEKKPSIPQRLHKRRKTNMEASKSMAQAKALSETLQQITGPVPPERTSSRRSKASTHYRTSKPRCLPALNGFRDEAFLVADDGTETSSQASHQLQPRLSAKPSPRLSRPSVAERHRPGIKEAKSSDTLTMIEARLYESPDTTIIGELKQGASGTLPLSKRGEFLAVPPEEPLPDLPVDVRRTESQAGHRVGNDLDRHHRQHSSIAEVLVDNLLNNQKGSEQGLSPPLERSLSPIPPVPTIPTNIKSDVPPMHTPSSVYSQPSFSPQPMAQQRTFARHDLSGFRSERIKDVKSQIKVDIGRERRISEEELSRSVTTSLQPPSLPPVVSYDSLIAQSSDDQLDKFPAVPNSRSTSRASGRLGHKTHTRQNSSKSLTRQWTQTSPGIRKGAIQVLVDCDPVDGNFNNDVASYCSIAYRSSASTPVSSPRREKSTSRDSAANTAAKRSISKKSSWKSFYSNSSAARPFRAFTLDNLPLSRIDSEDDDTRSLLSKTSSFSTKHSGGDGKRQSRRRWNSNDIAEVRWMHENLVSCQQIIMNQEKELRKQREEIQMMVRVYAPLIRQHAMQQTVRCDSESLQQQQQQQQGQDFTPLAPLRSDQPRKQLLPASATTTSNNISLSNTAAARPISGGSSASGVTNGSLTYGTTVSSAGSQCCEMVSIGDSLEYVSIPMTRSGGHDAQAAMGLGVPTTAKTQQEHHQRQASSLATQCMKLPEEMSLFSDISNVDAGPTPAAATDDIGAAAANSGIGIRTLEQQDKEYEEEGNDTSSLMNRLSLNHYLTSTDEMDRALQV